MRAKVKPPVEPRAHASDRSAPNTSICQVERKVTVDGYDFNTLRVLAYQHQEQRLREAAIERLAREGHGSPQRRMRVRLTIGSILKPRQRPEQPRFEG